MLTLFFLACTDGGVQPYAGLKVSDYFGLDGERLGIYNNDDTTITWQLNIEKKNQTALVDGRELVTFEYSRSDTFEILGSAQYSVVPGEEVLVHAYSMGATGELLAFDPPVLLTESDDAMSNGDAVVTETKDSGGTSWTFTSTLVEQVPECPTTFSSDFEKCAHFTIDDGDGDDAVGPLFGGDYTLVNAWGPAYMQPPGWEQPWELTRYEYEYVE